MLRKSPFCSIVNQSREQTAFPSLRKQTAECSPRGRAAESGDTARIPGLSLRQQTAETDVLQSRCSMTLAHTLCGFLSSAKADSEKFRYPAPQTPRCSVWGYILPSARADWLCLACHLSSLRKKFSCVTGGVKCQTINGKYFMYV